MKHFRFLLTALLVPVILILGGLPGCGQAPVVSLDSITITPAEAEPGKPVTIQAVLSAEGEGTVTEFPVSLTVNNEPITSKFASMNGGDSQTLTFSYTPSSSGTYTVRINDKAENFTAKKPAHFTARALRLSADSIIVNDKCVLTAEITNDGERADTFSACLMIDDVRVQTSELFIEPGDTITANATWSSDTVKTVTAEFCGLAANITVNKKPATFDIPETKTYHNSKIHYEVTYPRNFNINSSDVWEVTISHFMEGEVFIRVDRISMDDSLDQYMELLTNTMPEEKEWIPGVITDTDANHGYRFDVITSKNDVARQGIAEVYTKGDLGFYISYTAETDVWESVSDTAEEVLSSFIMPEIYTGSYKNRDLGVEFVLPDGWTVMETGLSNAPLEFSCYTGYEVELMEDMTMNLTLTGELEIKPLPTSKSVEDYVRDVADDKDVFYVQLNDDLFAWQYSAAFLMNEFRFSESAYLYIETENHLYKLSFTAMPSFDEKLVIETNLLLYSLELD